MELYSHLIQNQTDLETLYQDISNQTLILKPLATTYKHLMAYLAIDLNDLDKAKLIGNYLVNSFKNPRSQGVSRFQSREELVNSVGK